MQQQKSANASKRYVSIVTLEDSSTLSPHRKKGVGRYFQLVALVLLCCLFLSVATILIAKSSSDTYWQDVEKTLSATEVALKTSTVASSPDSNPRIAIISSFLLGSQSKMTSFSDFDHIINKACYAKMWGYDFIFNMTYGFDKVKDQEQGGAYWLDYGTWHRVPHIRDRIKDYDWILYADVDYVINDMTRPLESFFKEWQLYGKNPSVFIPKDFNDSSPVFSAFAVLVKNDAFGRSLLDHWMEFGKGMCEKGNFSSKKRRYDWKDSDQPGLWYALTAAHRDFFPQYSKFKEPVCNNSTGLIQSGFAYFNEMTRYFQATKVVLGSGGTDLSSVPDDQPILWSLPNEKSYGGLGLQLNWKEKYDALLHHAFAFHSKQVYDWPARAQQTLALCKNLHGCYANYSNGVGIQIGCNDIKYTVAI